MDLGLTGKVALVAGGSSGLGLAVATELAAEGARVAIGARDPDRLAAARRAVPAIAHSSTVDVTDLDAARTWVDRVAADLGALHIVVSGGGGPPTGTAAGFDVAEYRAAVDTVLLPAVNLALAALPHLRTAGWGRLLFITSESAGVSVAQLALSGVARAGIVRFAQSLAADVGTEGITVNVLAPGATRTPLVERGAAKLAGAGGDVEAQLAEMGRHTALRRIARVDEFGAFAAFLASERASYVTGAVHLLDGGASVLGHESSHLRNASKDTFR